MPRRTASSGLASLDRGFAADYSGDEIDSRFPGESGRQLIRRGILADAGLASTITRCICDLRRPECVVRVDTEGGRYWGYCNEYGSPLEVSRDQIQRYRFDWKAWADWLRHKNTLDGAGPVQGVGALFVGSGRVGGRRFGLVVVAPGCQRAADVVVPEDARQPGRVLVALLLGERIEGLRVDATVPAEALGADFETLDGAALERALDDVSLTPQRWGGRALTSKEAAQTLEYPSGSALLKAVGPERVEEGDPLYILRQGGAGRTPGRKFYEDAVAHVAGLLGDAGRAYKTAVAKRLEQTRAAKARAPRPDPAVAERRLKQALTRQEKNTR